MMDLPLSVDFYVTTQEFREKVLRRDRKNG